MPVQLRVERLLFDCQRACLIKASGRRPQAAGETNSPDADGQLSACLRVAGLGPLPGALARTESALSTLTGDGAPLRAQTAQPHRLTGRQLPAGPERRFFRLFGLAARVSVQFRAQTASHGPQRQGTQRSVGHVHRTYKLPLSLQGRGRPGGPGEGGPLLLQGRGRPGGPGEGASPP